MASQSVDRRPRILDGCGGQPSNSGGPANKAASLAIGDEFIVVCESLHTSDINRVVGRIKQTLQDPYDLRGLPDRITASVGTAARPGARTPSPTGDDLIAAADAAL